MSFDFKIENNDISIGLDGDIKTVEGTEKLIQDILKVCLTEAGSNPLNPGYGSYISKSLIGSVLDSNITTQVAQSQLQNSIELLKSLQEEQLKQQQVISPDEHIASILEVSINRNLTDPRLYDVKIRVVSKGFKQSSTTFSVKPF